MITYGHFIDRKYPEALDLGIRGTWINADVLGETPEADALLTTCYGLPEFRFILFIYLTENRLVHGQVWQAQLGNAIRWLFDKGIAGQCSLIQIHDEWWTALYSGALAQEPNVAHWPSLRGLTADQCWSHRQFAATLLGDRARELRRLWHTVTDRLCPPIGMSETGACEPPEFAGQDWWGLDIYLIPGGQYPTPQAVQQAYAEAWAKTRLPIMPVLGLYQEPQWPGPLPSIVTLGEAYLPAVQSPRTFAVGVFCLSHPSQYLAGHPSGLGVLDGLHPSYADGVRYLCASLKER